jgi:peptide/nickel transport system permease protein
LTPIYIIQRFVIFIVMIWVAATLVFFLPRLAPGDPIEQQVLQMQTLSGDNIGDIDEIVKSYQKRFGLDKPLWRQYTGYIVNTLKGDLGFSLSRFPSRVSDEIMRAAPWTIVLIGTATVISALIGSTLGALIAWRRSPTLLRYLLPFFMGTAAIPYFLIGLMLIFSFGLSWQMFPLGAGVDYGLIPAFDWKTISNMIYHAILPAFSIIIAAIGFWGLGMRAMIVTVGGEDFIQLADAKGLKERRLFLDYGIRNTLLPQTTALALALGGVISGQVLLEVIFSYPGLGLLLRNAIGQQDFFLIQGIVLMIIAATAVVLFIMDLIYPILDPRISYKGR